MAVKRKELYGWCASENCEDEFDAGIDRDEKHSGTRCAYLRSVVRKPKTFGNLMQTFQADAYLGKRLRMSAWVKTKIVSGTAQLWVRVDGDWKNVREGCFDNMDDRPVKGVTEWSRYEVVVDVPETSTAVAFGMFLNGTGQAWFDDVSFEVVGKEVPLTGKQRGTAAFRKKPVNLNFEEDGPGSRGADWLVTTHTLGHAVQALVQLAAQHKDNKRSCS